MRMMVHATAIEAYRVWRVYGSSTTILERYA
jgi:hypothetical protein